MVAQSFRPAPARGWLVPIGGGLADPAIFERFVALCGGPGARLVVVPVASSLPRTGYEYADALRRHGASGVAVLDVRTRTDSENPDALAALARADGVFFTGGDQVRLAEVLGGTPIARLLRRRWAEDELPVAGTSAGASYLSERMIARGWSGPRPRPGMVTLITGLGLATDLVIDQHFRERRRQGRLLTAVSLEPECTGVGVDENTAAFIAPDGETTIVGTGGITVIDARSARPIAPAAPAVHAPAAFPTERRRRPARPVPQPRVDVRTLRVRIVATGERVMLGATTGLRADLPDAFTAASPV
ncbi:MAG TPA: cyanophycinase [Gemmatirosa sp.]